MASSAKTSPLIDPVRPRTSCRAPRTAPSMVPSILTTPLVSIWPRTFMPTEMTESAASPIGTSFRDTDRSGVTPGCLKIDIGRSSASRISGRARSESGSVGIWRSAHDEGDDTVEVFRGVEADSHFALGFRVGGNADVSLQQSPEAICDAAQLGLGRGNLARCVGARLRRRWLGGA